MDPSAAPGTIAAISDLYGQLKEFFTDFKPEARTMSINFSEKTAQLEFQISIPEGWRKSTRKVKIPALEGYRLIRMLDVGFREKRHLWKRDGDYLVLDAKELTSERYLVEMEGRVDKSALDAIVYIKPAANRDNDEKCDKYWLEASIKNVRMLENTYKDLNVDEVNFGVRIDIDRIFALATPPELKAKAEAQSRLLATSSKQFDRTQLLRAAMAYRRLDKTAPSCNLGDFSKIVYKVTGEDVVRDYIRVERPYDVGNIDRPARYIGIVPQDISVQALTRLTLRSPVASGCLVFDREGYMEKLRSEFKNLDRQDPQDPRSARPYSDEKM